METTETTSAVDPNAVPVSGTTTVVDKGGYTLELVKFEKGEADGFSFNVIQYKDVEAAFERFGQGDKEKGKTVVLALLNSQLKFALRNKAKSKMPDNEDDVARGAEIQKLKDEGKTLLLSEEDASNYIPGTREKTSLASILKEIQAAKKAGNLELAAELMVSFKEKLAEMENELLA